MAVNSPRALLLDLDNTVYAYAPCHRGGLDCARWAAARVDAAWADRERFATDYLAARRAVKEQLGPQAAWHSRLLYFKRMLENRRRRSDVDVALHLEETYWEGYFAAMRRDDGCAELLAELRRRGVASAWVTSFTTERQVLKLQALGLADAVDYLVTTEEAGVEKPDAALADYALERLGVEPEDAWMVGDSLSEDLPLARARAIPFAWRRRPGADAGTARPDFVVDSWHQLRELLDHAP